MDFFNQVIVMNEKTWEEIRTTIIDSAHGIPDPIGYLASYYEMKVVIDNDIENDMTEIWDIKTYNEYMRTMEDDE